MDTSSPAQPEATIATTSSHLYCPGAVGLWEQKCPEEKVEKCDTWPRILPVGTDLLAGPQKAWLAISFPPLLPAQLTACQGRSMQRVANRTARPCQESWLAYFLTDAHGQPFPDQWKPRSIVTSTAAPSAPSTAGRFVTAASHHLSPYLSRSAKRAWSSYLHLLCASKGQSYLL